MRRDQEDVERNAAKLAKIVMAVLSVAWSPPCNVEGRPRWSCCEPLTARPASCPGTHR